jgi:acyl-CoA synthetase (NDP forming)
MDAGGRNAGPRDAGLDLRRLLAPSRVAIVGSTSKPTGLGSRTIKHLHDAAFPGTVTAYSRGDQVPEGTDVAVIAVPAAAVQQVLDDIGSRAAFIVVYSSGFEEVGRAPLRSSPGTRLLGPNTVGLYYAPSRTVLTFAQAFDDLAVGGPGSGVFLVSQSGAFGARLVQSAARYGLHLDGFVGTGNEVDLDACTVACGLIDSAASGGLAAPRAILLYLEGLRAAEPLVRLLARARDAGVAVVALLGGLSEAGALAATSHTSAVSSDHAVVAELFAFYGASLVRTDRDLVQAAVGLSLLGRRPARRVGVVTGSGGAGVVAADILSAHGLVLPELSPGLRAQVAALLPDIASARNPVDVTAQTIGDNAVLGKVCATLRDSGEVDLLLVIGREDQAGAAGAVAGAAVPTVVAVLDRDASGVRHRIERGEVVLPDLAAACTALAAAAAPPTGEGDLAPPWPTRAATTAPRTFTAAASLELVGAGGVATAPWRLATSVDEVLAAGDAIGWPVVLKSNVDASLHKARGGHVRLDVDRERAADTAAEMLREASALIVARQLRPSLELFAGVRTDPQWGLVVSAGLGGANIELLNTTVAMPARLPVGWLARRLAERIFNRVPGRYEGLAEQLAAAAGALVDLARRGGHELVECNPIGVVDGRLVALDARVVG